MRRLRCLVTILFVATQLVAAQPPLFEKLTLAQARAKAAAEKKGLLVDATATWCGPCKQLDRTTWVDPQVVAWCRERYVAIQLDVDASREEAMGLGIRAMPTIILFGGERELDRMEGYKDPAQMLAWFQLVAAGKREVDRLADQARGGDLQAHVQWADALLAAGQKAEATEQYLWLWDHMLEKDPSLGGVRYSIFQQKLQALLEASPEARSQLVQRETNLRAQRENPASLRDWVCLTQLLADGQPAVDWALQQLEAGQAASLKPVETQLFRLFATRQLWKPAGQVLSDPVAAGQKLVDAEKEGGTELPPEIRANYVAYLKKTTGPRLEELRKACQAAGRTAEAEALTKLIQARQKASP